jgi:hypothetical protein
LLAGWDLVLLNPPEQRCPRRRGLAPEREAEETAIRQAQHVRLETLHHGLGQGLLAAGVGAQLGPEKNVAAGFHQADEAELRIGATPARGTRTSEGSHVGCLIGHFLGAAVDAHQAPVSIPRPFRLSLRQRPNGLLVQLLDRLHTEPAAGLGNPRLTGHRNNPKRPRGPAQALQKTAQNLAVGSLRVERQGDDVVHHHRRRKLPLPQTGPTRSFENPVNQVPGKSLGDDPEADVVRNPTPCRQFGHCPCHVIPFIWWSEGCSIPYLVLR